MEMPDFICNEIGHFHLLPMQTRYNRSVTRILAIKKTKPYQNQMLQEGMCIVNGHMLFILKNL